MCEYIILEDFKTDKFNTYLADINEHAENMFLRLVKQMAECEGVTEQRKADNQIEWVGQIQTLGFARK